MLARPPAPQGTFKIVEVSDIHHTGNLFCKDISPSQQKWPCSDANGTAFFQQAIRDEDPDVFVFTGDNVCSGDVFGGQNALDGLLKDFVSASNTVPWLAVEGNHGERRRNGVGRARPARARRLPPPNHPRRRLAFAQTARAASTTSRSRTTCSRCRTA